MTASSVVSASMSCIMSLFIRGTGYCVTSIILLSIVLFSLGAIIHTPSISVAIALNRFRSVKSLKDFVISVCSPLSSLKLTTGILSYKGSICTDASAILALNVSDVSLTPNKIVSSLSTPQNHSYGVGRCVW